MEERRAKVERRHGRKTCEDTGKKRCKCRKAMVLPVRNSNSLALVPAPNTEVYAWPKIPFKLRISSITLSFNERFPNSSKSAQDSFIMAMI